MKTSRRHALGQHFLASPAVLRKIAEVIAPRCEDVLVEIGAGRGVLTVALAATAGKVVAVEKDECLVPALRREMPANVEVIQADVLRLDWRDIFLRAGVPRLKAVGNIPYSISSPLLFRVLDEREILSDCVFLLQKEVAERVAAGPGSKAYAPLGILLQNYFVAKIEFKVAPGSFSPPPKVQSAVLSLRRRSSPLHALDDEPGYAAFLRTAFAERRKMLWKNLSRRATPAVLAAAYESLGIARNARAEQVSPDQFAALFEAFQHKSA